MITDWSFKFCNLYENGTVNCMIIEKPLIILIKQIHDSETSRIELILRG